MTSEVCVMNRHAAVLAADSASTVTRWDGEKHETRFFKGANKIFQLSHHQPVGVMIFNSAELLRVPWEIIIKTFRDHLGSRSFNDLSEYASEFFLFLHGNQQLLPDAVQRSELIDTALRPALLMANAAGVAADQLNTPAARDTFFKHIAGSREALDRMPLAPGIDDNQFNAALAAHLDAVSDVLQFTGLADDDRRALAEFSLIELYKRPEIYFSTAGLVFAGFGNHDIFPKMVEFQSCGVLSGTAVTR
jgi:hypothetical protein